MRNWWYESSTKQKWFVGGLLMIGVNLVTWFIMGFFSLKLGTITGCAFIRAWMLPSDYDD
ncbi:hypothetical protein [Luteolibacter sp. LG18]|uniref:hypothetical protein n=1 Tax=Luteolibacter sp. LG18 TaxID=2819286 RepID=UPI002B2FB9A7|nr:hypothetical protein llg_10520 [Luteolibacter sp. LG18]